MIHFLKNILILSLLLFTFSSCAPIFYSMYGLKPNRSVNTENISKYAKQYNVPEADLFVVDTNLYHDVMNWDTTLYKTQIKDHLQPLQALYYDSLGKLVSFQINCYAGGFPNLKWNRDGIFNTFPPQEQAPLDDLLPLNEIKEYLLPLSATQHNLEESNDYTVVVLWTIFMGRQSKRLIKYVQKNIALADDKKVKIIYGVFDVDY